MQIESVCAKEVKDTAAAIPHILPVYATSSFAFESIDEGMDIFKGNKKGYVYSRYGNPTVEAVASKLAALETHGLGLDAHCILSSSGMSAISTLILALLKSGDKVLTQGNLYGGTTDLFRQVLAPLGIEAVLVDLKDENAVRTALENDASIKMIYCETPANPSMACADLALLSHIASEFGVWTTVDNTFPTPYLQQPFKFKIDFIIHSTTKYLNGHGNAISGAIIGKDVEIMKEKVWKVMKLAGTNCNPMDAWLLHNGMKTLSIRMDRHSENALKLAEYLQNHSKVARVNYAGLKSHPDHELAEKQMRQFGGMLSFELKGGLEAGVGFMNKLKMCTLAPTLGDVDTLVLHPASSSHLNVPQSVRLENGISDGLVRVSVGIEHIDDIIADIKNAIG